MAFALSIIACAGHGDPGQIMAAQAVMDKAPAECLDAMNVTDQAQPVQPPAVEYEKMGLLRSRPQMINGVFGGEPINGAVYTQTPLGKQVFIPARRGWSADRIRACFANVTDIQVTSQEKIPAGDAYRVRFAASLKPAPWVTADDKAIINELWPHTGHGYDNLITPEMSASAPFEGPVQFTLTMAKDSQGNWVGER